CARRFWGYGLESW
nr:immunoglobulin heavy chain junction region [Macaca mulatta]MOV51492.1 immunoglobulin heavy chain junction region [Macaca mulatta]